MRTFGSRDIYGMDMLQLPGKMTNDPEKSKRRDEIDANLRRVYSEFLDEEVPERLKRLIEELRKKAGDT